MPDFSCLDFSPSSFFVSFLFLFSSRPVLDVGSDLLELREDLREERGLGIDPEHGAAQLVDDVDAAVPEFVLVRLHEERLQGVADLVAHVTRVKKKNNRIFISKLIIE